MIDSYWDLYVAYIDKCLRDNCKNGIDPHHYEMEWNHTLPQCLFGDWPVGQYLTLAQHAIASALQTLALQKNCMCGWHKKYLPKWVWDLCSPYYSRQCSKSGEVNSAILNGHPNTKENRSKIGKSTIRAMNDHPNTIAIRSENGRSNAEKTSRPVLCVETGQVYASAWEASRATGIHRDRIRQSLRKGCRSGGYHWSFNRDA